MVTTIESSIFVTGGIIYAGSKMGKGFLMAELATIREESTVGDKTIVGRNATIENVCTVGSNCKIQTNAYITAYSEVGDNVFIAPGVVTTNDNFAGRSEKRFKYHKGIIVKNGGRIAANTATMFGITINEDSLVVAGGVVTKDNPAKKIVMGSPAKEYKDVSEDQLLENQ